MTIWTAPTELPDLRHVGEIAIDTETLDRGLQADRGSSWPWGDGYVCGIADAWREGGEIRAIYIPLRHPDTANFDPAQVYRWLKDHIAAGVRFVTMNGLYDWGWVRTDGGVLMPPSNQLEEVGALAAMVDENQLRYSLEAICQRYGLPGKDETLLLRGSRLWASRKGRRRSMPENTSGVCQRAMSARMPRPMRCERSKLYETLTPIIAREGTRDAYRLEVDLLPMVHEMRRRGIRIDQDAAEQAYDLFIGKRNSALKELSDQHGAAVSMVEIRGQKMAGKDLRRLRHQLSAHSERQSIVLVQEIGMDGRT